MTWRKMRMYVRLSFPSSRESSATFLVICLFGWQDEWIGRLDVEVDSELLGIWEQQPRNNSRVYYSVPRSRLPFQAKCPCNWKSWRQTRGIYYA